MDSGTGLKSYNLLLPFLAVYIMAILVQLPRTFLWRLALLPITLLLLFRCTVQLDLSFGLDRLVYLNLLHTVVFTGLAIRAIKWTFQNEPPKRLKIPAQAASESSCNGNLKLPSSSYKQLLLDAFDLCYNLRGYGWTWSTGLRIPPETRRTSSTSAFLASTAVSMIFHFVLFDICQYFIHWFSPSTFGSPDGGSIFDSSLPPALRYLRASTITTLCGLFVYSGLQMGYDFCTTVAVLVFQQHPSLWPPGFDRPWLATSLTGLWARRWHQWFRDCFISIGGYPLSVIAGRVGFVLGCFIASAALHDIGLRGMGKGGAFPYDSIFFIMSGVGILLEHSWWMVTGIKARGFAGWIWTMTWTLAWGLFIVDAWARKGIFGSRTLPPAWRPSTFIFGGLPD